MKRISKSATVRGITFLPNGQQMTGQLPSGDYRVIGNCTLSYCDLGQSKQSPAVKLECTRTCCKWYIAPAIAADLPDAPEPAPLTDEQSRLIDATCARADAACYGTASKTQLENQAWTAYVNSNELQRAFPQLRNSKGAILKSDNPAKRFAAYCVARRFSDAAAA